MDNGDNERLWLDAALCEYQALRKEMLHFLDNFRRDSTIVGGLLAGAFALQNAKLGWISDNVIVMIPSALFAYVLLQIANLHMSFVEARQCARIEEKINQRLGGWPMEWESRIATRDVRSPKTPIAIATAVLIIAIIGLFIGVAAVARRPWWLIPIHIFEVAAMALAFSSYIREELKRSRQG